MWWHVITKNPQLLELLERLRRPENSALHRAAVLTAGLVAANVLLYAAFLAPSTIKLKGLEQRHAELRKRHAEAVLFQKQKESYAGIRAGIPTQKDMPLLVKELVQTARRLNLSVGSINYEIPQHGGEGIALLSFSFPAEGAYPNVKRFIYEIEASDRIIGIQDLKLDGDKGRVRLEMKFVTYIKASEPQPSARREG